MAYTAGANNAGLSASIASTGGFHGDGTDYSSGGTWTSASSGAVMDGTSASSSAAGGSIYTDQLKASQFGFNIPSSAVILGILVEYNMTQSGAFGYTVNLNKGSSKNTATVTGNIWAFGGAADLWGATWTASDINSSSGFYSIYQGHGLNSTGLTANVDGVRITVYWDYPPLPKGTVNKEYIYEVSRQGVYLGLIPNVTSPFAYSQDINTAGSQITITCAVTADTADGAAPPIETEDGNPLETEAGVGLYAERQPDIVGNSSDSIIFRNGNQVVIYEVSDYYPNGHAVFSGDIERWSALYGGTDGDSIKLTVYSDGAELNNFIMTGGDTLDQSQTSQNGVVNVSEVTNKGISWNFYGQTFTVGSGVTNLEAISIYSQGGTSVTLRVYSSVTAANANNAPLANTTQSLAYTGTATECKFVFAPVLTVTPGQVLFFAIESTGVNIYYNSTSVYSGGEMYNNTYSGGSGGGTYGSMAGDLMFKTYSGGNATTIAYSSTDPTNMFIDAFNRYNAKGGIIKVASGTTDLTGLSLSYTFKVATLYEGIQKMMDMSPYDWYWYVDIGTDTAYFKQTAATPKWYFTKGRHISGLNLSASTENVKNIMLFTGGDTGSGVNLFSQYTDAVSIQNNKQRLERKTDNRVTIQGTADAIGGSFVTANKNEVYQTSVTIVDTAMDISLFRVGDTVGFTGFGNFIDALVLQISRVEFQPEQVTLTLGDLAPRVSQTLKEIDQQLNDVNTLDNPTTPS